MHKNAVNRSLTTVQKYLIKKTDRNNCFLYKILIYNNIEELPFVHLLQLFQFHQRLNGG